MDDEFDPTDWGWWGIGSFDDRSWHGGFRSEGEAILDASECGTQYIGLCQFRDIGDTWDA